MVLRALPSVAELNPTIRYDIIGKGDDETRLKHLASSLGVEKYVRFHGLVSEEVKARLLRQASIFALPNRREGKSVEGFGIVFMEAAAYGVPSVAGSDGGAPDAVIDGETGMIADGRSDRAVANALLRLLGDNAWRQTLGSAARKRFWQDFAWDSAVGRFENALFGA
jgi:phosphatidylinositol alpha-1,6-mannosyltransferase